MTSLQRILLFVALTILTFVVWDYAQTVLGTTLVLVVGLTLIEFVRKRSFSESNEQNPLEDHA